MSDGRTPAPEPAFEPSLLAVPNISEGRDEATIAHLASAFTLGALLLDTHSDPIHNRTVFTLAPTDGDVTAALAGGAGACAAAIDLTTHRGEHPRIGALDVAPVVYLAAGARDEARERAQLAGEAIAAQGIPVFYYGELAASAPRRERAFFRNGGIEALAARMRSGELEPDLGPHRPHPTAGATLVSARPPLAAFNLELDGLSLAATREIAAALREASGGLPGVRAIGLALGGGTTQVSTNVHDPIAIPLAAVVRRTGELAAPRGGAIVAAEVVGLVPRAALDGFPDEVELPGFDRERGVIEERMAALGE